MKTKIILSALSACGLPPAILNIKRSRACIFALAGFIVPQFLLSQNETGTLSFFVRDAENGYGIKSEILISGNETSYKLLTDESGHAVFNNTEGEYTVSFMAQGHRPLQTHFSIQSGNTVNIQAHMDRNRKTPEQTINPGSVLITGYAVDFDSGKPLQGVNVSMDGIVRGITDEKGFFSVFSNEFSVINTPGDKIVRKSFTFSFPGYSSFTLQDLLLVPAKISLKITMEKGIGEKTEKCFQHVLDGTKENAEQYEKNIPGTMQIKADVPDASSVACTIPSTIRVGTSCSCTTCSNVSVMSLQYYSESGIDDEWISSWQFESLAAGSIPYRSYGGWYVNNPVNANYDIANTTCNQVWGSTVYANAQSAAQSTSGIILTADGVNPARSEYSAENNYGGTSYNCSDCNAGGSGIYACHSDNICCGKTPAGHGRGMCQWGSQRWALNGQNYQWIINQYYIVPAGYSLCGGASVTPSNLAVQQANCPDIGVWLNWQNSGNGWFIDVTNDATWNIFWNHDVSNLTTIVCPGGFELYPSQGTYLQFQPNTTYYWRIWDGNAHTYGQSFTTPICTYSDNNCSGTFTDFGGVSAVYFNNEDWTMTISPPSAASVTMNFTSFDLEDQYDFLYFHDGNSTASPLIGTYTGVNSPGTISSTGPSLTAHFVSDPFVQNAGWEATWNCTPSTTGIFSENSILQVNVYPTISNGIFTISSTGSSEIIIYNALGEKIYEAPSLKGANNSICQLVDGKQIIDLNSQPQGIYFVKISSIYGQSFTKKLIIQ